MISSALRNIIKRVFNLLGLEIHRPNASLLGNGYQRNSLIGMLQHAKDVGLSPATVIDVGAAYGTFTSQCFNLFPDAYYVLLEPLKEYKPFLEALAASKPRAKYIMAAAYVKTGETIINVHPDLVGSSLYLEEEDSDVNGVPRAVQTVTLDSLMKRHSSKPPFFLKIDVQGAELDVLMGAEETLQSADFVLLEVSLFEFFKGGPQFFDILEFMNSRGFVAYDIVGLQYRPLDNALSQVDMAFVKERGLFRTRHYYATRQQREQQNERFASERRKSMRKCQ